IFFFFSSRRRHTRFSRDWSSDVCSSDLVLLGLGIGIDYALFIVNRHRLGLKAGREVRESVRASVTTSGRAVVFAGITVFIALAGMFVPRIAFLSSLATAAAITVLFSVAASVTLVPALLTLYG